MHLSGVQLEKWVINLSKGQLSKPKMPVLAKGLSFAVAPDRIHVDNIMLILQAEKACNMFKKEEVGEKQQLRAHVREMLKSTELNKSKITKEERTAVKDLGRDKAILIHPADKRRATVVMYKEEYDTEIMDMLADERTYEKLSKDPTQEYIRISWLRSWSNCWRRSHQVNITSLCPCARVKMYAARSVLPRYTDKLAASA